MVKLKTLPEKVRCICSDSGTSKLGTLYAKGCPVCDPSAWPDDVADALFFSGEPRPMTEKERSYARLLFPNPPPVAVAVTFPLTGPLPGLRLPVGVAEILIRPSCTFRPKRFIVRSPLRGPALHQLFVTEVRIGNYLLYKDREGWAGFHPPEMRDDEEELGIPLSRLHRNESLLMPTMEPPRNGRNGIPESGTRGYLRVRNVGPRTVHLGLDVEGVGMRREGEGT